LLIRTAIRVGETSAQQTRDDHISCGLSAAGANHIFLPHGIRHQILSHVRRLGGMLTSTHSANPISIQFSDSARMLELPSLFIVIQTQDGREVQIAQLDPLDYMVPSEDAPHGFDIFFWSTSKFVLTRRIIENLLIHIDYHNNRIGFADPLVEL